MANDPFRLPPPCVTWRAASLKTRSMGIRPFDEPFVPAIYEPVERMRCILSPIPPDDFDIKAHVLSVSKIPSILQKDSCLINSKTLPVIFDLNQEATRHLGLWSTGVKQSGRCMGEPFFRHEFIRFNSGFDVLFMNANCNTFDT